MVLEQLQSMCHLMELSLSKSCLPWLNLKGVGPFLDASNKSMNHQKRLKAHCCYTANAIL